MCGIFGFTFRDNDPLSLLKKMGETQQHRGPDGDGYYVDDTVSLGMRRLSIIDIEHGQQPFYNLDRTVVVICNGEIYNYIELREELVKKGHIFKTHSDVEVLPYLYDEYGIDFINKLNGMYSIALYDKKEEKVFLIRDRLGIKPLYYAVVDNNLIFSSELKSIFVTDRVSKEINFDALSTYLELMYIPAPMSPFRSISKLPSGSYLKWSNGNYEIRHYWQLSLPYNTIHNEENAMQQLKTVLMDSMRIEMRSDVPVGSFLSGGIDSSAVTAIAAIQTETPLSTFHISWGNAEGKFDETEQAIMVSRQYGTRHFVKNVFDKELITDLPKLIWHLEEPFADGALVFTYGLAKEAAKHVKVILSGAGGDELFGGYSHHVEYPLLKSIIGKFIYDKNPKYSYYDKWKPRDSKRWRGFFDWFRPSVYRTEFDELYKINRSKDMLNAIMLSDLRWYLQDDILFLNDKMTMAVSLECRVPLLDHRIVEVSIAISSDLKVNKGEKKYIFKKLMEKYLPNEVLYRPKEGFGAPIGLWVNTYKSVYFDRVLQNGYLMRKEMINSSMLFPLIRKQNLSINEAWQYWKILILDVWMQLYIEGRHYASIF